MVSHPIKVEVPEKLQTLIPAEKLAALVEAFGQIDLDQDGDVPMTASTLWQRYQDWLYCHPGLER